MTQPQPVRIIDLLDLARCQQWQQVGAIMGSVDHARLCRLKVFLVERVDSGIYVTMGYYEWHRAMVDLLEYLKQLIGRRDATADWPTLITAVI